GVPREAVGDAIQFEPGREEARGLRTLPGAHDDDHPYSLPTIERERWTMPHKNAKNPCGWRTALPPAGVRQRSAGPSRSGAATHRLGGADRAQDQGGLQDERLTRTGGVPADDLADALEAVTDGVGVHEQLACCPLQRAT